MFNFDHVIVKFISSLKIHYRIILKCHLTVGIVLYIARNKILIFFNAWEATILQTITNINARNRHWFLSQI